MAGSAGGVSEAKSNTASAQPASAGYQEEFKSRIPMNWGITSMVAVMLAADRIASNVLGANPDLRDALYRKYLGASEEWLRSHGASVAEATQETLDWVEQLARRLVAVRLANLQETTTQKEQRA